MTVRSESVPDRVVWLELPAEHRYLNVVSACLAALLERVDDLAERDEVTYNMQLAVQEACSNIVDHAYDGRTGQRLAVGMSVAGAPQRLIVDLYDTGQPFDEAQEIAPSLEEPQVHGYGLFLMRQLADEVHYERLAERNHWMLSKEL